LSWVSPKNFQITTEPFEFQGPSEAEPKTKRKQTEKSKQEKPTSSKAAKSSSSATESKPVRNFAPPGETNEGDNQNNIHWEGYIGGNYHVKLQTWKKNDKLYLAIRKNQNIGANIPIEYFHCLLEALRCVQKECADLIPSKESDTSD